MAKSKQDWLDQGLNVLGRSGARGLTVDRLAGQMQLTKGSFYHHFKNMADFEEQLVAYWAEQYLATASAPPPQDPDESLALLDTIIAEAFAPATEPELAIRTWAQEDSRVRAYVERVDAVRRVFLLHVFRTVTGDEERSQLMADLLFTMLIGSLTSLPRLGPGRVLELYREFKRLYGLPDRS